MADNKELLRMFFLRWSTIDLNENRRLALKQDAHNIMVLLNKKDVKLLQAAVHASNREFFAMTYRRLIDDSRC